MLFKKYFCNYIFLCVRSTFHSGQTRRPAPASQYGVPISSQVPTYFYTYLPAYLPSYLPSFRPIYLVNRTWNLTFYLLSINLSVCLGYQCSKFCCPNLLLLQVKLQVFKTLRRNRNVNINSYSINGRYLLYFTVLHSAHCSVLFIAPSTSFYKICFWKRTHNVKFSDDVNNIIPGFGLFHEFFHLSIFKDFIIFGLQHFKLNYYLETLCVYQTIYCVFFFFLPF